MSLRVDDRDVKLTDKTSMVVSALAIEKVLTTGQMIEWISKTSEIEATEAAVYEHVGDLRAAVNQAAPGLENLIPPKAKRHYRLNGDVATIEIDAESFVRLLEQARDARPRDLAEFVRLSRAAIAIWGSSYRGIHGGEPLAGLRGLKIDQHRRRLQGLFRSALLDCLEAELDLGRHRQAVPELQALAHGVDLDQRVVYLLMLALHREGRSEEALTELEHARDRVGEYGGRLDRRLKTLFQDIRSANPVLDLPHQAAHPVAVRSPQGVPVSDEQQPTPPEQPIPSIGKLDFLITGPYAQVTGTHFTMSGPDATVNHAHEINIHEPTADGP
ncbi:AfsR/SARP family transcriptional regulator [Herbidospora cretacea]|uniref:AfsR/SARP family transcriptional regulator n=1 Tax=Herbidospora cretacea TaxID=28444 RepID=UPI0007741664|nr:bacterial transcriptional activator domain-containing protein [Herbidospora cretacea]